MTRSLFGLALVLAGLALLLANWGLLPPLHFGRYIAPAVLIVLGLSRMTSPRAGRPHSGVGLLTLGVLLLLSTLHVWSFRESWPIFIVVAGLGMVLKASSRVRAEEGVVR